MLEQIRKLCREKNISMDKLEQSIGISKNSIYKWDSSSPSIDKVISVAEYFGVSLDYLTGRNAISPDGLEWCLQGLNDEGISMVINYANFILSQPQYKKYNFSGVVEKSS